jgi:membrane protein YqaA with SNARE-associated domain
LETELKEPSLWKRVIDFHSLLKTKGIYSLAGRSILQLLVVLIVIGVIIYFAQMHINDFKGVVNSFLQQFSPPIVLTVFFISETFFGMIPPDFFIVWSNSAKYPLLMLSNLALLSYIGGMMAYLIGRRIGSFPRINNWLRVKLSKHFATMHKYGGFLIVFSALFPLPFSTITMVTGMIKYPFTRLAVLGLTRLLRFVLYALVLFKIF